MPLSFEEQPQQGVETGFLILTRHQAFVGYTKSDWACWTMVSITVQSNFDYALSFRFFSLWQPLVETGARSQVTISGIASGAFCAIPRMVSR